MGSEVRSFNEWCVSCAKSSKQGLVLMYNYFLIYNCRLLGAEEAVRQAVESREAQVKEKADSLEQAETRHT